MPASKPSVPQPLRNSWPAQQVLLQPGVEGDDAEIEGLDLGNFKADEDPLIYFLAPTTPTVEEDGDSMEFEMEFDAGIEDAKHPPQIVRSVSPSSLLGLSRPPPRPPTPPRSPATPDLVYDMAATPDELDDYMPAASATRYAGGFSIPLRLKDLTAGKFKGRQNHAEYPDTLLPAAWPHSPHASNRGRAMTRPGPKPVSPSEEIDVRVRRHRTMPTRLSPHAWREPSPDVWAIEEEAEKELDSDTAQTVDEDGGPAAAPKAWAIDIPAAQPKKKVRFVLPGKGENESTN
ncbi:hypothetical protein VTK56DRAFT_177 [Thermocarpiscus australiensis]